MRIMGAAGKLSTLSYSMCFVHFPKLREFGKLVAHEQLRKSGDLVAIYFHWQLVASKIALAMADQAGYRTQPLELRKQA